MPAFFYYFSGSLWVAGTTSVMAALIFWRHRSNIRKIIDGTEKQLGHKD
jgi:glycerol-3-phosphate acyltransferase PlsY